MDKFFNQKSAKKTLGFGVLLMLVSFALLPFIRIDYDFEKFFPQNDEELDFYLAHRDSFATDNDFLLIALEPKAGLFNEAFLQKLESFTKDCNDLPHVNSVSSLSNIKIPIKTPIGWNAANVLNNNFDRKQDSARVCKDPMLAGKFISPDNKATLVFIQHKNNINIEDSNELIDAYEAMLSNYEFDEYHISGKLFGQRYYINKMRTELAVFASISLVLLALFLFISFRAIWTILLPIALVASTVVVLLAVFVATNTALSPLTTIMPTILFVVGISDVVHLLEKIIHEIRAGKPKLKAIQTAYKEVGLATFLTTLTTSIGFFTLILSPIQPIGEFALFTGIGVWIAFILTFTLFPAAIILLKTPAYFDKAKSAQVWENYLSAALKKCIKKPKIIGSISLALIVVSIWGASKIEVNNFIIEDLGKNDPQRADYEYLEKKFAGVRPFDFNVSSTGESLLKPDGIKQLLAIENHLKNEYEVGSISSVLELIRVINRGLNGGNIEAYKVPTDAKTLRQIEKTLASKRLAEIRKSVISNDFKSTRFLGRVEDIGGKEFKPKNEALMAFCASLGNHDLHYRQTGMGYLIDKNNEKLSNAMLTGLSISFLIIAIIMAVLFKNPKMIVISLIPNVVPLLMIAAFMGFTGINLKVATSIIFTIAFGIAVDDSIHLLSRFKIELQRHKNPLRALYLSYTKTGKAVIVTSAILFSGFIALWFSSFASTFYLGLLVSMTLAFAVIADLTLIPILVLIFYRKEIKQHKYLG